MNRTASNDEIKELLKAVGDSEVLISEASQGFSLSEIRDLLKVANDLPAVIKDLSVMWPEYKSLDEAGRNDLMAYVKDNCKYPANVAIESFVQKALEGAVVLSSVFALFA